MMPHVDGLELCQSVKTGLGDEAPYYILLTAKARSATSCWRWTPAPTTTS